LAYHQLEAGHWWTQWLMELRTLADAERWDVDSATARLDAPLRWERIQRGIDHALVGLDRAKIPSEVRQGLQSQQHSRETAKIASSITARRWQQSAAVSLADDLDARHRAFISAGEAIAPALADARRRIQAYLPNLAEMARGAAERLRQAERAAKEKRQDQSTKQAAEQMQQQQQQAQQQAEKLREALVDEANTQDLTTQEGLRSARDADIASRAISQQMEAAGAAADEAVRQTQQTTDEAAAEQALRDAAGPLAEAAHTLEQIAQHYENAQADDASDPEAVASSLVELEQQLGLREQLDSEFARSAALAETLQSDPRELLKKLSEELKRNQQMRRELSEITDRAVQDAQRSLQQQAERERQLRLELEKQDPRTLAQKRQLEETLRAAVDNASAVQRSMLHAAKQAAARLGDLPEDLAAQSQSAREKLEAATQELQQAAQDTASLKSAEQESLADLRQRVAQFDEQLGRAIDTLKQGEQTLEQLGKDPAAALANDRKLAEQRDMQNLQRQARDTLAGAVRNHQNRLSQASNQATQQSRQIRSQLQDAERKLADVDKRLAKKPDDDGLKQERGRAVARLDNERQRLELAEKEAERRRLSHEQAKERLAEIGRTPLTPLEQPRPAAELAQGMQTRTIAELRRQQEELAAAAKQAEQMAPLRAAADLLAATERSQGEVQGEVQRAAENLQRVARHQERLGDQQGAEAMAQTADAVSRVADQEVKQAREAIDQAAQQAQAAPQATGDADASRQTLSTAEQAISAQVQGLLDAVAQAAQDAARREAEAADARAAAARQLAQTLDELDRSLTQSRQPRPSGEQPQPAGEAGESGEAGEQGQSGEQGQPGEQPGEQGQPGGEPGPGGEGSPSPTLAAAARRQMQQMAMQRTLPGEGQAADGPEGPASEGEPQDGPAGEGESQLSGQGSQGADPSLFRLPGIDLGSDGDWGRLRALQAEDTSVQRRVEVSPEFRQQIEAYFRVIAEQAQGD
jgi:hypothetical protein